MRNERLIFEKTERMRFISHLDINKYFIRLFRMADVPIWYTEGFSPHPYVSFALPLSLGFESVYEIADLKITDDAYTDEMLTAALNKKAVPGIRIREAFEPVLKTKYVAWSQYRIVFDNEEDRDLFFDFLTGERVVADKTNKKGIVSSVDLTDHIKCPVKESTDDGPSVGLCLPSGNDLSLNPTLCFDAFKKSSGRDPDKRIIRTLILDNDMRPFR